jgi:hypothetical protein
MPNEDAFFMDDRDEAELPEFSEEPCMTDCAESIEITMRAAVLDVTPETEEDDARRGRGDRRRAARLPTGPTPNWSPPVRRSSAPAPPATRSARARAIASVPR